MPADFSRFRFDPLRDFAAVQLQQGRVTTDSDSNEGDAIFKRDIQALASDVLGRATVSQTTPDAFLLTPTPSGNALIIGKGRMYVDGLRAENHGYGPSPVAFDDLLAEPVFSGATPLEAQPYMPVPLIPPERGKFLVYLDVWQREVTHLQAPDLVEVALGVDTSSRLQTVWQVRLLESRSAAIECNTPDAQIPGWADLIAPSIGRLSTGTYEVPPADDPCELPPTGGYRGLENQLYRVEIHRGGQVGSGGATFKWSRENATIASLVSAVVSFRELELDSLGRDEVLGLRSGDWVEIVDDTRELSLTHGELRRITVTGDRQITLDSDLPAPLCASDFRGRHLRVVRWDQRGKVLRTDANGPPALEHDLDANMNTSTHGAIPVPPAGTELLLEHGVKVSFSVVPGIGEFKTGDYWLFAARTADATVEILDKAPPRGIHHHYARLGVWTVGQGVTDCRVKWPPGTGDGHDCDCVACVTVDSHRDKKLTIQQAVERALEAGGGTVCIGPGNYQLEAPIQMVGASAVRIRGAGWTTRLFGEGVVIAQSCSDITLENLAIVGHGAAPAVSIHSGFGLTLRGLLVIHRSRTRDEGAPAAIALRGALADVRIVENFFDAPVGIRANDPAMAAPLPATAARDLPLLGALEIERNRFACGSRAIDLATDVFWVAATRIADNDVMSSGVCAIQAVGRGLAGSSLAITGNNLNVPGAGIRCGGQKVRISDNTITNPKPGEKHVGIELVRSRSKSVEVCEIVSNRVNGYFSGIAFGRIGELLVTLNVIVDCCNGIVQDTGAGDGAVSIENNHLVSVGGRSGDARRVLGICVADVDTCTIAHNTIRNFGNIHSLDLRAGIATFGARRVRISGNELVGLASAADFLGRLVGILVRAPYDDFSVSDNRVERDVEVSSAPAAGDWTAISVGNPPPRVFDEGSSVSAEVGFAMMRLDTTRVLVFNGDIPAIRDFVLDPDPNAPEPSRGPSGSVLGNAVRARGRSAAVEVTSAKECSFSDNRVELVGGALAAVLLTPRGAAIVSANRVRGGSPSIHVRSSARFTVLGNVTTGGIQVGTGDLAEPWAALNVTPA
jgi:hypothetical protein